MGIVDYPAEKAQKPAYDDTHHNPNPSYKDDTYNSAAVD